MTAKPNIFQSRKFWIVVFDSVVSIITMIVTILLANDIQTRGLVLGILASLQPVIIALINGIATEDAANVTAEATKSAANTAASVPAPING